MIYRARVIDNSMFSTTGKIRVRIKKYSTISYTGDLSKNPMSISDTMSQHIDDEGKTTYIYEDSDAVIYSPIGGGYDYGMFYLPQVNSWGLVADISESFEDHDTDFVWMGTVYDMNASGTIDSPSSNNSSSDGVVNNSSNIDNMNGALVIKLKHTELSDPTNPIKSQSSMDWKQRAIENLIIIDKDKLHIIHNIVSDNKVTSTSYLKMDSDGININYNVPNTNNTYKYNSTLKIDTNGYFHYSQSPNDGLIINIDSNSQGIESDVSNKGNLSIIQQNYDNIDINIGGSHLNVQKDTINIESKGDVNIAAAGSIHAGSTDRKVLIAPTGSDSVVVGDVTLSAIS